MRRAGRHKEESTITKRARGIAECDQEETDDYCDDGESGGTGDR